MTPATKNIKKGDLVTVQVTDIDPGRVLVRFEDGREGYIRNRELSWKRSRGERDYLLNIGEMIAAVVINADFKASTFELSLRQVQGNPWDKLKPGHYRPGMVMVGEVVNIEHFGAFIELEPGIDALLHSRQIPGSDEEDIQNLLWVGDQVEVSILQFKYDEKRIEVSINAHPTKERIPPPPVAPDSLPRHHSPPDKVASEATTAFPIRHILVIDNDCNWANAFAESLSNTGYDVHVICDLDEIESTLDQPISLDFEIAFIDIELSCASGIEVAGKIQKYNPKIQIFLITGLPKVDEEDVPSDLKVLSILFKPVNPKTIAEELLRVESSQRATQEHARVSDDTPDSHPIMPFVFDFSDETMNAVIRDVKRETHAETVILFSVDTFTEEVKIVNALADDFEVIDQVATRLDLLRFSPVRNVAFENDAILEKWALNSTRVGKLPQALYFESCIGVPVPFAGTDTHYVLFLFHSDNSFFDDVDLKLASAHTHRIAAQFQQKMVYSMLVDAQQQILNGQLASQLAHEVRNQLNGIFTWTANLETSLKKVATDPLQPASQEWQEAHQRYITNIQTRNEEISRLVDHYLGLVADQKQLTQVNDLIENVLHQIKPLTLVRKPKTSRKTKSEAFSAELSTDLHPDLPDIWIPSLRLKQIFLNVALNALQQMSNHGENGTLQVTTRYLPQRKEWPIQIRFTDTGPGIHRKHWERVFDPGFTTRVGGTGLGLFVCRVLVEAMGGRISVERSYMFTGTTFLIQLPVATGE